jgi:hypothetical protein
MSSKARPLTHEDRLKGISNYWPWALQMSMVFRSIKAYSIAQGTSLRPPDAAPAAPPALPAPGTATAPISTPAAPGSTPTAEQALWDSLNEEAFALLGMSMSLLKLDYFAPIFPFPLL